MSEDSHTPQRCRALFEKMSQYLDNELDKDTRNAIEEHLKQCPPCRACLATLSRTVSLLKNLDNAPVPEKLTQRLQKLFQQMR
jgi:anti-sigma factor RsiW